jgi:hypothetical protein
MIEKIPDEFDQFELQNKSSKSSRLRVVLDSA